MSTLNDLPSINIPLVIKLCKAAFTDFPILGQLAACQAILESNLQSNPSLLALKYCNLFGQKVGSLPGLTTGTRGNITFHTEEVENGETIWTKADFLYNNTLEDSIEKYRTLVMTAPIYSNVKYAMNFQDAATRIATDGYATDPDYIQELITIYNKYKGQL